VDEDTIIETPDNQTSKRRVRLPKPNKCRKCHNKQCLTLQHQQLRTRRRLRHLHQTNHRTTAVANKVVERNTNRTNVVVRKEDLPKFKSRLTMCVRPQERTSLTRKYSLFFNKTEWIKSVRCKCSKINAKTPGVLL